MIVSRIDTSDAIQLPAFSSLAEERQHRKERLAASFRLFSKFGFDEGVAGHITARELGDRKAIILRNHGLLTVGRTVDEAVWWFITMERSCQCQLLAEAVGKPIPIDPENAALTRTQLGTHEAGWFQFQPLWSRITREQPDLFH